MRYKPLFLVLLLCSSPTFACFTNSSCPAGNICVKTGNVMGVCMSAAGLYMTNTPYATTGNYAVPASGSQLPTTTIVVPGTTPVTNVPSPGVMTSPSGTSSVPIVPGYTPPVTAGTCTNDINCPTGFACSRPGGTFRGICVQIAQ